MSKISVTSQGKGGDGGPFGGLEGWEFQEVEVVELTDSYMGVKVDYTQFAGESIGLLTVSNRHDFEKTANAGTYMEIQIVSFQIGEDGTIERTIHCADADNSRRKMGVRFRLNPYDGIMYVNAPTTTGDRVSVDTETKVIKVLYFSDEQTANEGRAWIVRKT